MSGRDVNPAHAQDREPYKRIVLLNSIALASPRSETTSAIAWLREALALCGRVSIPVFLAQTHLNLSRWLGQGGFFDEALEHLAISENKFRALDDRDGLRDVVLVHALILLEKKELEDAYRFAQQVYAERLSLRTSDPTLELVKVSADRLSGELVTPERSKSNNELKLAIAIRVLATIESLRMDYFKALYYLDTHFELWQNLGQPQELASALTNAGSVYARIPDFPHALEFLSRALTIYRQANATGEAAMVLARTAGIHSEMGSYALAVSEFDDANNLAQAANYTPAIFEVFFESAKHHVRTGDLPMGRDWSSQALELAKVNGLEGSLPKSYALQGKILVELSEFDEAIIHLETALKLSQDQMQLEVEVSSLHCLYLSYKAIGNVDRSFHFLERFQKLESQLLESQIRSNADAIQRRFQTRFAEASEAVTEAEHRELLEDVERLSGELAELIRHDKQKDKVLGKLHRERTALANHSLEAQELLGPLLVGVTEEVFEKDSDTDRIRKLLESEKIFMQRLRRKYPTLSRTEVKVCALIHVQLSSLEIASLLDISIRTVENHRLHIRQKLALAENVSLSERLMVV